MNPGRKRPALTCDWASEARGRITNEKGKVEFHNGKKMPVREDAGR